MNSGQPSAIRTSPPSVFKAERWLLTAFIIGSRCGSRLLTTLNLSKGGASPLCTYLDHHKFGNRAGYLLSICEFYNILPALLLKRAYEIRRG